MTKKEFKKIQRMFHVGDIVIVKEDLPETKKAYGCTSSMISLKGQMIEIGLVDWDSSRHEPYVHANGWKWHPNDLYVIKHEEKSPLIVGGQKGIFKFDPKNLQGD